MESLIGETVEDLPLEHVGVATVEVRLEDHGIKDQTVIGVDGRTTLPQKTTQKT